MTLSPSRWFDGHLDLAALALLGRELSLPLDEVTGGPKPPTVTWPSLREGGILRMIATIFTAPDRRGPFGYPSKSPVEEAHRAGLRQLGLYQAWEAMRLLRLIRTQDDLETDDDRFGLLLSLEGADPVRQPEEMRWWYDQGVRLVGMSWSSGTRYAGGNAKHGPLTEEGRALVREMEALGIIHDLSHLSDEAAWTVLEQTTGPVIASHSNCRSLLQKDDQRFLSDELLRALREREGMVGLNLLSAFLSPQGRHRRATMDETLGQIEHICTIMDSRDLIGLGSDLDGGFGADSLPEGIQKPADLERLLEALAKRGWKDTEIAAFRQDNWLRFLAKHLPSASTQAQDKPPNEAAHR